MDTVHIPSNCVVYHRQNHLDYSNEMYQGLLLKNVENKQNKAYYIVLLSAHLN
jgi:hypothetical protein